MKKDIQNIYDNKIFFEGYKALRQNNDGFNEVLEQPAIYSLLPELKGKNILDIGCGFGFFEEYAINQGANSILGIDPSVNMIEEAKKHIQSKKVTFQQISIESFEGIQHGYDLVVSSVAFHYVEDFSKVIKKIKSWLKPNGMIIFSVEHPICTAYPDGVIKTDENGKKFHPVYNYRDEKEFLQHWFVEDVQKYHRTVSTYINTLIEGGFTIEKILEPMPTDEQIKKRSQFFIHAIRPPLLVIKAIKK